jgi:hypothetical protein
VILTSFHPKIICTSNHTATEISTFWSDLGYFSSVDIYSVQRVWISTGRPSWAGHFGAMVRDSGGAMCKNSGQTAWVPSETGCTPFLAHMGHCWDQSPSWPNSHLHTFIWWVMKNYLVICFIKHITLNCGNRWILIQIEAKRYRLPTLQTSYFPDCIIYFHVGLKL